MLDLVLITARPGLSTSRRLGEAASTLGWRWAWKHPLHPPLRPARLALTRLGLSHLDAGLALTDRYAADGTAVVNPAPAIRLAKNKWSSQQALEQAGLPVVPTVLKTPDDPALLLDGRPTVVKTLYGAKGVGVHLAESDDEVATLSRPYHGRGYDVLLQPRLDVTEDLRLLVAAGTVVAAVRRTPGEDGFRANWHRGGGLESVDPRPEISRLAVRAATVVGLGLAGIDILIDKEGTARVLEINDSPGLTGIETATGRDLARDLLQLEADALGQGQ